MILARRSFLRGAVALLAAPAIVRVASIMPVHPLRDLFADDIAALIERDIARSMQIAIAKLVEHAINPPLVEYISLDGAIRHRQLIVPINILDMKALLDRTWPRHA